MAKSNQFCASIAIFHKKLEYSNGLTAPPVPKEVMEAVERVSKNRAIEVVRTAAAVYLIEYSETGPWKKAPDESDWLPVFITRLKEWHSGGVREEEFKAYQGSSA